MRTTARERSVVDLKRLAIVVVVALVVLVAGVVGAVSLYSNSLYASSYESHYDYRVTFTANQSLSNVTVYVPLPVEDGVVRVVGANLTASSWDETTPAGAPPVTASVVDTERGPMLAITAVAFPIERQYYRFVEENGEGRRVPISEAEYDPANPEMVAYTERSVEVTASVRVNRSIDTRAPTPSEPLLAPATNRHEAPCRDAYFESQRCYTFDSAVYLAYDAPPDTRSSVWVEFAGRNEWWVFGWNGDEYRQLVSAKFVGPQDGWRPVAGELETGFGSYGREPPAANRTG